MSATRPARPRSASTSARPSTDMGYRNLFQRKPPGASCNWVKEEIAAGAPYVWWRTNTSCAMRKLGLVIGWTPNFGGSPSARLRLTLPGFTLGGASDPGVFIQLFPTTNTTCGTLGSYVSINSGSGLSVDLMKALQDGEWTSSITFTARISGDPANGALLRHVIGYPNTVSTVFLSATVAANSSAGCSHPVDFIDASITVYDDGRITIT